MEERSKLDYRAIKRLQKRGFNISSTARILNTTRSEVTETIKKYFEKILGK